ncbi:MAG: ABC transporter substrate binding protein [bacterium]
MKKINRSSILMLWCMKLFSLITVFFISSHTFAESLDSPQHKKHILILNSYNQGYSWTDNEVKGIQDVFKDNKEVILHIEYMDTKIINDPRHKEMLADIYARKYPKDYFSVVITTDDDALRFMRRYHEKLFNNTPIVFAGVNNYKKEKTEGLDNITGVNETTDFASNLNLIKHLLPNTQRIVVINDDLTTGKVLAQEFQKVAKQFDTHFTFEYLTGLSMFALKQRLSQLEKGDVIFYVSFFRDGNGVFYTPAEAIPQLSAVSRVPMFGAVDYMVGKGIVGGFLKNAHAQGTFAGELAQKILLGEKANALPVVLDCPMVYTFDYQQLQRFGFSMNNLPIGSTLINEPEGFYYRYKYFIWTALAIFLALLLYIVLLLMNIQQRRRTEKGLQGILESSHTLFDINAQQQFKESLFSHLSHILPNMRDTLLLRYKGKIEDFDEKNLDIIDQNHTMPINEKVSEQAKKLIENALKKNGHGDHLCVYDKKQAVALLENKEPPVNLVYVSGQRRLDKTDQQLLELFAGNVSMSINNAETYKLSASLQTAQRIQQAMLPMNFAVMMPLFHVDLHAFVLSAKEVGGDLYDFFALDDDHLCIIVGDVSDKGVPAAIFMAMAKTVLRSVADIDLSPAEILYQANNELSRDNQETMFVTLFLGVFNRHTGHFKYADGGHNTPYLLQISDNKAESVLENNPNYAINPLNPQKGTALGVMEDLPYFNGELYLKAGEGIFLYTDGVTEAANRANVLYEEPRLMNCLEVNQSQSAKALNQAILDDVQLFAGDAPQSDDITALFMRYQP